MVTAHITGEAFNGKGVKAKALHQLAGSKNIPPYIAALPA